jgi:hypothetical protein
MRTSSVLVFYGLANLLVWSFPVAAQQVGAGHTPPKTDEEMIANALAAAPAAVAQGAAVIAFDDKGNIRTLRQGTN